MSRSGRQHVTHEIDISAPAEAVYQIIADASAWPRRFTPTVHAEKTDLDGSSERLHIWAYAGGEVKTWTSRRVLDEARHRVSFQQEVSSPPVASMGGEWIAAATADGRTRLTLHHDFEAVDDGPESIAWITKVTDQNSKTELANIKALAERWDQLRELEFTFKGSVQVNGPIEACYEFLYEAGRWPERLSHVARLELKEEVQNIQWMSMDTRTKDGQVHTTESVRVCFPAQRIVYKQLRTPALISAHTGEWLLEKTGDGVLATSWHAVTINEAAISTVLGEEATIASARDFVRTAIGGNSEITLGLTKAFAEEAHD